MNKRKALIIGGSAGSLEVLIKIVPHIRIDIDFPIIIVVHRKQGMDFMLTDLLANKTFLKVKEADEKEAILNGVIYIAPSNYHLLVEKDFSFSLDYSEKINYSRPSIDATFQSAAEAYKDGLYCLLLSGSNADGVKGLICANKHSGTVWVQDTSSAQMSYMPEQAILKTKVNAILKIEEMASYINAISCQNS